MAYRQEEKVEFGIWPIFAFLVNPAFWAGVGQVATTLLTAAVATAPKSAAGDVVRPETSTVSLFTSQPDIQKQINEVLAKAEAKQEALMAEERAKQLATWQKALWAGLIIVGGVVIWKEIKKRK